MGIFGATYGWGEEGRAKSPPSLKSVTHIMPWWNLAQLYLSKRRSKKHITHVILLLSSAKISISSTEISNFCYIKKYRYRLHFNINLLFLLTFLEPLKVAIINLLTSLMMTANWLLQPFLKKVFWNKGDDVIISVHDSTNKILSCDLNFIADVIMRSNFGNFSISTKGVIITTIL